MKRSIIYIFLAAILLIAACKKGFLDQRPDKALLVPQTLADFRALLDNINIFNRTPGLTGIADGDSYTPDAGWKAWAQDAERNSYTWAPDIFVNSTATDWALPYQQVFYANVVLDGLQNLPPDQQATAGYLEIKGIALFNRAFAYFSLAQQFAPTYNEASAATDPGLPLRLTADVTRREQRSSVRDTYALIFSDLAAARGMLPLRSDYRTRPTLAALYALLARIDLSVQDYEKAGRYADSCLQLRPALLDYNTLSAAATRPFPPALPNGSNEEVIWYSAAVAYSFATSASQTLTDSVLYRSYAPDDLRGTVLFRTMPGSNGKFKGSYTGAIPLFTGLATDEMYLIRAECRARKGDVNGAMADLSTLLQKRWRTSTYTSRATSSQDDALGMVLQERRKELTGRNQRWSDLRRLNSDPRFRVTLNRSIDGVAYTLEPLSPRYVYPIPPDELKLNPLVQNPR